MTPSEALLHLRYSEWASRKLMDAVRSLPAADLEKPTGVSHASLLGTLAHIQFADWVWYTRVIGPMDRPDSTLETLETVWPELHRKWQAWAASADQAELDRVVEYKSMDGTPARTPAWQIVLHLVNHATLHRGQAMAMLRQMGIAPPHTDLLYYYRELAAAAAQ